MGLEAAGWPIVDVTIVLEVSWQVLFGVAPAVASSHIDLPPPDRLPEGL
jgi:hypothetical protein